MVPPRTTTASGGSRSRLCWRSACTPAARSPRRAARPRPPRDLLPHSSRRVRHDQDTVTIPRDRWDDVRIRLARAEAEASERGLALADARLALRALTAGPVAAVRLGCTRDRARPRRPGSRRRADPPGVSAGAGGVGRSADGRVTLTADVASTRARPVGLAPSRRRRPSSRQPQVSRIGAASRARSDRAGGTVPNPQSPCPMDLAAPGITRHGTGGYVPAVGEGGPVKKRRWWQSR